MLSIYDLEQLVYQVSLFFLVLCRVTGLVITFPLTREWLPQSARLLLALALSVIALPRVHATVEPMTVSMVITATTELLIGVLMGSVMVIFFSLYSLAGHLAGMQMALGLAEMNDPVNGVSVTVVSRLYHIAGQMMFVLINGHLVIFVVLVESFQTLPPGNFLLVLDRSSSLIAMTGWMFGAGLLMVLPIIICLLTVNLAFGFITRSAPQMNLLTLGFPLSIMAGLVLLSLNIVQLPSFLNSHLHEAMNTLRQLVG